jgi:hypothetical protein
MIALAVVGGGLALLAASVVREAAVAILAAAGQNAVQVSWWVFLSLTFGIFLGLVCLGYWAANPIAKVYAEMNDGISTLGKRIDAKRHASYKLAARVDAHQKHLHMIDARSRHDQLIQLHLAAQEVAWRGAANPHIYGVTVDPSRIQDVIGDPSKHVRDLTLPSLEDRLTGRIDEIRDATGSQRKKAVNKPEAFSTEEEAASAVGVDGPAVSAAAPDESAGLLEDGAPLDPKKALVGAANGNGAIGA